jgi:hypothetical protein
MRNINIQPQKAAFRWMVLLFMSLFLPTVAWGMPPTAPSHSQDYQLDSGIHAGTSDEIEVTFEADVRVSGASWMRLHFSDVHLAERSFLTITSLEDGSRQRLDAIAMAQWQLSSAFFNGDAVNLQLHAAPGDSGIFFRLARVTVGDWVGDQLGIETICGTSDDRVASTDSRVGRLFGGGCTAYLVSNGAVLTAGHCVDFDPDGSGSLLPDGVLDLTGVVEFNVPASRADGTPVMADADDQYAIDTSNVTWHYDGEGQGLGKDWAVFGIFANANNDDRAHLTRGFLRMTREAPATGGTIRITGFGLDNTPSGSTGNENAQSYTEQTHTGPYQGESSSGGDIWHGYRVDTTGGNSGSPIIWEAQNLAIGIHTNGGCTASGGENSGTSFEHDALENALADFAGGNTVYIDSGMPAWIPDDGSVLRPYTTMAAGIGAVATGGRLSIVKGSYSEAVTISRAMTLTAPVGAAIIGQ